MLKEIKEYLELAKEAAITIGGIAGGVFAIHYFAQGLVKDIIKSSIEKDYDEMKVLHKECHGQAKSVLSQTRLNRPVSRDEVQKLLNSCEKLESLSYFARRTIANQIFIISQAFQLMLRNWKFMGNELVTTNIYKFYYQALRRIEQQSVKEFPAARTGRVIKILYFPLLNSVFRWIKHMDPDCVRDPLIEQRNDRDLVENYVFRRGIEFSGFSEDIVGLYDLACKSHEQYFALGVSRALDDLYYIAELLNRYKLLIPVILESEMPIVRFPQAFELFSFGIAGNNLIANYASFDKTQLLSPTTCVLPDSAKYKCRYWGEINGNFVIPKQILRINHLYFSVSYDVECAKFLYAENERRIRMVLKEHFSDQSSINFL